MLTGNLLKSFHQTLLRTFTSEEFRDLLESRMGLPLNLLVPPSSGRETQVFEVIQTAERAGWTGDLVRAAYEARPDDQALARVYEDLGLAPQVMLYHSETPSGAAIRSPSQLGIGDSPTVDAADFRDPAMFRQWLAAIEARVCRVEVGGSHATGFLVGPGVVLTCCHVLGKSSKRKPQLPDSVRCRFDYRKTPEGLVSEGIVEPLVSKDRLVDYSPANDLDYALLRLENRVGLVPSVKNNLTIPPRGWFSFPVGDPEIVPGALS